ncbi:MAG: methyltransferase domain-containing protein [Deltaproteobacteria bacterium]|nr:methyltransferase domain-containing protein [Deltaproteobacteria bacterium]
MSKAHGAAAEARARDAAPKPMTRAGHHARLVELLEPRPRGRLLDLPCGQGALSQALIQLGFDVTCADIDPGFFRLSGTPWVQANLNAALPFGAEEFDYVACIAGLHRLHSPQIAIREFRRVLRPKGTLIVSFPNYAHLRRRLHFLWHGYISKGVTLRSFDVQTVEDEDAHFRTTLLWPTVRQLLLANGFAVEQLEPDRRRARWLQAPLAALIRLVGRLTRDESREAYALDEVSSSAILTGGDNLIVVARKS